MQRGDNMAEEPQPYDAWVNSVVRTLRGLFRNGETPPRVAIVVAVDSHAATPLPTPERIVSTDSERSTGSWDEVPEIIEVVLPHRGFEPRSDLPTVVPASEYTEQDDYDTCRHCGAGIIHRSGDTPRFWHTQWGKRYHVDHNCYGLRTAMRKFPLHCLADKPHLTPCKLCV